MKTQETVIKVLKKEHKTGTTNAGKSWETNEYTVEEDLEREDGSISETKLIATTSTAVGDLDVGGVYKAVIFITSRETEREKDGKKEKIIWNSFRITRAEKIGGEEPAKSSGTMSASTVDAVADEIPF